MLYSCNTNISENFIKDDLRLQWTNETHFFIKISLSFYSSKGPMLVVRWEIDGEIHTQREDFFLSHTFYREPGGANACTPLQARQRRPDRLRFPRSTPILCTLFKSDHVVLITWSLSGYIPVVPECPDVLSSLFIHHSVTACQSTRGHEERTENPCHMLYNIYIYALHT